MKKINKYHKSFQQMPIYILKKMTLIAFVYMIRIPLARSITKYNISKRIIILTIAKLTNQ